VYTVFSSTTNVHSPLAEEERQEEARMNDEDCEWNPKKKGRISIIIKTMRVYE
jgi:hypothetical protein